MIEKHRSVFWRAVAGRIGRGRGPDAARGPPVGQRWSKYEDFFVADRGGGQR